MVTEPQKSIRGWESPIAIHPGKFLEETLGDFSMSQAELSDRIGLSKKVVNEIIKGKNPVTRATAFKLGKIFPISEEYWVNLQNIYENDKARLEEETRIRKDVATYLPNFSETYRELSRIGATLGLRWIGNNFASIVLELQKFFAINSLGYVDKEIEFVNFRKYKGKNLNRYTLAAWLRLGKIKAQNTEVEIFNKQDLRNSLQEIRQLSLEGPHQYLPKLEKILNSHGVVLAYIPYLKNTNIQGASTWVNKDKALIMLNTSKRSEDRFWFNLFHEIGHVLKHGKTDFFVDLDDGYHESKDEKEANIFAQECLIPNFDSVVSDFKNYNNHKEAIENISKKIDISPSILAGRIAHELSKDGKGENVYKVLNSYFETKINYTNV